MKNNSDTEQEIMALLRANIRNIVPYSTARDDCQVKMDIYLDANENPSDSGVNRYPSPHQPQLKRMLSVLKGVPAENIFLGNGSDEPVDLLFRLSALRAIAVWSRLCLLTGCIPSLPQ